MLMLALRLILKGKVVNNSVCHLLILSWGLRYFWKSENIRTGCVEIEEGFKKILCKAFLLFNCFLVIKGIPKALFSFIPWLLSFSDLPHYRSNSRKRYTLRLLSKCLGRSTPSPSGVKSPPTLRFPLPSSSRWAPFNLALHLCSR